MPVQYIVKCPYCGNEMEDGFIGITGSWFDLSWYRKPTLLGFKGEPLGGWGLLANNFEAHRCVGCRTIVSKY